jgi:hypothetical protein
LSRGFFILYNMITIITAYNEAVAHNYIDEFVAINFPNKYNNRQSIWSFYNDISKLNYIATPELRRAPHNQHNLIIEVVNSKQDTVILTYSDHIINGLLVAIKQGLIDKDDCKILFFNKDNEMIDIPIIKGGRIRFAPEGFFDQYSKDRKVIIGF